MASLYGCSNGTLFCILCYRFAQRRVSKLYSGSVTCINCYIWAHFKIYPGATITHTCFSSTYWYDSRFEGIWLSSSWGHYWAIRPKRLRHWDLIRVVMMTPPTLLCWDSTIHAQIPMYRLDTFESTWKWCARHSVAIIQVNEAGLKTCSRVPGRIRCCATPSLHVRDGGGPAACGLSPIRRILNASRPSPNELIPVLRYRYHLPACSLIPVPTQQSWLLCYWNYCQLDCGITQITLTFRHSY